MTFSNLRSLFKKLTAIIPFWAILIGLLFILVGLLIDTKGFIVNLLAGAIEIISTVTIINWLLLRQKRKEWVLVRLSIIKALNNHLLNIASEFMMNFHATKNYELMAYVTDVGKGYESPCKETVDGLDGIVAAMKKNPKPNDAQEQAEMVHKIIKWDVDQIRSAIIPRILAMGTNELELIKVLSDFDNADREWVNQYIMDKEVSAGEQYEAAIDFIEKLADVYKYLTEHP